MAAYFEHLEAAELVMKSRLLSYGWLKKIAAGVIEGYKAH
jgi:hypothetical protein